MSESTLSIILCILFISMVSGTEQECKASQLNGRNGFCISSSNCDGLSDSRVSLCGQNIVCCYGTYKASNTVPNIPTNTLICQTPVSRLNWKALAPRNALKDLAPVSHVFIHHTNDGDSCYNRETCSLRLRALQSYHQLTNKWDDIAWNFLIGKSLFTINSYSLLCEGADGNIYEGVGGRKQGFHTLNWNDKSLGIAFIGNFNEYNEITESALDSMLDALDNLLSCAVNQGYIRSGFKLHGHRDIRNTTTRCPGDYLYSQLINQFNSYQAGPL